MTASSRPHWQHDACPPWCVVTHRDADLPDDRFHDSAGTHLTATFPDPNSITKAQQVELFLARFRRVGDSEDWIHLEAVDESTPGLTLSPESARALGLALIEKSNL